MLILGLAGAAGSGKSAVAGYLVRQYGFMRFSFSDALYREVTAAFELQDEDMLRDRETKELASNLLRLDYCRDTAFVDCVIGLVDGAADLGPLVLKRALSPRQILQWWGTEFRRAADPNYWVDQAEAWLVGMHKFPQYPEHRCNLFVNDSVRFPNERDWIKSWEGNVWHLHRDAAPPVTNHESETPLPVLMGEREIFNNYTLDYLHLGIDRLLSSNDQFVRLEPPAPMIEENH